MAVEVRPQPDQLMRSGLGRRSRGAVYACSTLSVLTAQIDKRKMRATHARCHGEMQMNKECLPSGAPCTSQANLMNMPRSINFVPPATPPVSRGRIVFCAVGSERSLPPGIRQSGECTSHSHESCVRNDDLDEGRGFGDKVASDGVQCKQLVWASTTTQTRTHIHTHNSRRTLFLRFSWLLASIAMAICVTVP